MTDCAVFIGSDQSVTFIVEDRSVSIGFPQPVGAGEANTLIDAGANVHESLVASPAKIGTALQIKGLRGTGGIVLTDDPVDDVVEIGSGGGPIWTKDEFIPTTGQVTFVLSQTPSDLASLEVAVNGVEYDDGVDYTISGATITWLDPFTLKTKDKMIVQYE